MRITPHLWYSEHAEEAVRFYVSIFSDARIDRIDGVPGDTPSGPAGSVRILEFTLAGSAMMAIQAGPYDPFNHAISFFVSCDDQTQVDRLWAAFLGNGGSAERCGWLRDRWGLSWQIVPRRLGELMASGDAAQGRRVTEAMLAMVKLDIAALERAAQGE